MKAKKSCYNCKFLEWVDCGGSEGHSDAGYCCNKRQYKTEKEEDNHLSALADESYLLKPKSCCEFRICPMCGSILKGSLKVCCGIWHTKKSIKAKGETP